MYLSFGIRRDVAITPIPKPANCSAGPLENRPIANSSVWLKVIEKHLLSKLDDTLKAADDPFQFAYKSNRSTLDAVATLSHTLHSSLDAGAKAVKGVFLDFSSTFNTI